MPGGNKLKPKAPSEVVLVVRAKGDKPVVGEEWRMSWTGIPAMPLFRRLITCPWIDAGDGSAGLGGCAVIVPTVIRRRAVVVRGFMIWSTDGSVFCRSLPIAPR